MLHLHRSHRLERLADTLADLLRTPAGGPFEPEWVVVGGRPAERWMTTRLADRLGVCAHVRFLSPATLVETLVERTLGLHTADVRAWRAERLQWAVLAALRATGDDAQATPLRRYVGDAGPGSARAVQLARTIAGCFERYLAARPELVRAWDAGRDESGVDGDASDAWQPALWRAVGGQLAGAPHLVTLLDRTAARIATDGLSPRIPRRVVWLAQGTAARLHLDAAVVLARAGVDVHLLVQTSARATRDAPTRDANPLLASLARQGRDAERLIADAAERAGAVTVHTTPDDASAGTTALARLQRDVIDDVTRGPLGDAPIDLLDGDESIRVHVCHGRARQVDALRDELLRLFDARPDLMPRDVLVLTPDVAAFGPLVEAAFDGSVDDGIPRVPVTVADRPIRADNPAADAALHLLELAAGRVDVVALLDFLCLPAVSARFALGEREQEALRRWAREGGARWGIDAEHRAEHALPGDAEHTWRFALDRLLLGWALPGAERTLFAGTLPYDEIEGKDAELLGRLAEACERAFAAVRALAAPRSVPAWCAALDAALDTLLDEDAAAVPRVSLDAELRALCDEARAAPELPIDLAALRLLLEARFDAPSTAGGGAPGGIVVGALRAGRVVPARVVCLLGMDEGVFPRPRAGVGFDRLARYPVPGDADANAEDRQRFLEAVLAAGERLVVTYAGRTVDTNAPVAPAVPVSELLDVLDATFAPARDADGREVLARARVTVEHPLQPFSPRNFAPDAGDARSHDRVHLAAARAASAGRRRPAPFVARGLPDDAAADGERVVRVDELASFFANPAEALLRRRLRVWLGGEDEVETREPATLDALDAHGLRAQVLASVLAGDPLDDRTFERARGAGRLPHGALARLELEQAGRDARRIARALDARVPAGTLAPARLDHAIDGWRLVGHVGPRHGEGGLRLVQPGVPRARQIVQAWVQHLALHLAAPDVELTSWLVGKSHKKDCPLGVCRLAPVPNAVAWLRALLALYERGQRTPLPFFPATSWKYADALDVGAEDDPGAREAALDKASLAFEPPFSPGMSESRNAYVARAFGGAPPLEDPAFHHAALAVCRPLIAHLEVPKS